MLDDKRVALKGDEKGGKRPQRGVKGLWEGLKGDEEAIGWQRGRASKSCVTECGKMRQVGIKGRCRGLEEQRGGIKD